MALPSVGRPRVVEGLRLVSLVGSGGEGEVWDARDDRGRQRALKLVRPECLAEPVEAAARAAWLVRIDHPALVRVHRSGVLGPRHPLAGWGFVEMDYVDGESLASAPAEPGVLDRLTDLAEALDLLHAGLWSDGVPLVHRDVKPANIVERRDGAVVLVDPSTLRGVDATQLTRIGTPVFSAPEVLTGRIGPAADVYSFAVTIVALMTGLRGSALADALEDGHRIDLPHGVHQALSARPGDRPVSCRAVLEQGDTIQLRLRDVTMDLDEDEDEDEDLPSWDDAPVLLGETERHRPRHGGWDEEPGPGGEWPLHASQSESVRADPTWRDPDWNQPDWREPTWREAGGHDAGAEQPESWAPSSSHAPLEAQVAAPAADAWEDPRQPLPPRRSRVVLPWALVAAAIAGVPAALLAVAPVPEVPLAQEASALLPLVAVGAVAVHLMAHLVARRPLWLAIVVPPLAWAGLLAGRLGYARSRVAWARAVLLSGCAAMTASVAFAAEGTLGASQWAAAVGLAGFAATLLGIAAARAGGATGAALRLVTAPLWIAGAGLVIALCVVALPLGFVAGRTGSLLRTAGTTLGSIVEVARAPH